MQWPDNDLIAHSIVPEPGVESAVSTVALLRMRSRTCNDDATFAQINRAIAVLIKIHCMIWGQMISDDFS